jgi:hypothetical protein
MENPLQIDQYLLQEALALSNYPTANTLIECLLQYSQNCSTF